LNDTAGYAGVSFFQEIIQAQLGILEGGSSPLPVSDPILIVLILLAATLAAPFLSRWLRLPDIAVLILAGVALGPHGSGVMMRNDAVMLFASVGLLSLMFLAGIEIDIREYRKSRAKSYIFGTLTFVLPMALGFFGGLSLMGMAPLEALLLASLLSSHTLIAYPVLSRLRIAGDEVVAVTVGGTIIANVASLLVLSVAVSLSEGGIASGFIIMIFAKLLLFMFFMLFLLPRIAAWALERLEGDGRLQFLFAFAALFFSAALAGLAGVEPIIGAFMSGVALGRSVPSVSPLGNRLEFFGNAIFIPSFLISVGMLVDIRIIFSDSKTIFAASVMMAVILISKWLAAFFSQKTFSWNWVRREFVFGLSIGQAAGTLAVAMVGYNLGIFGIEIVNGGIVTILIAAFLSPLLVQSMGRRIAAEASKGEGDQDYSRRRILIGAREEGGSERLLELALMLHDPKGITDIRAVTVVDSHTDTEKRVDAAEKYLAEFSREASAAGHKIDFGPRVAASVAAGLANGASEFSASDIVIGLGGRAGGPFRSKADAVLSDLALRSGTRILAARLCSPLATTPRMALFLPAEIEIEEDFAGTLTTIKTFVRQCRSELVCYGFASGIKNAHEIFDANPPLAGVRYEECGHEKFNRAYKQAEDLRCVLLARRDGASWSHEMKRIRQLVENLSGENPLIVFCPAVRRAGTTAAAAIPGALGRFWDKMRAPWLNKGK